LKIFMALSDLERNRPKPFDAATVDRLAREFRTMSSQYPLFAEAPGLSDKTVLMYLDTARDVTGVRDPGLRADTAGSMQALAGLWQILTRQGAIAQGDADTALSDILTPFAKIQNERDVFDAGYAGIRALFKASHSPSNVPAQDQMLDLLAGSGP